MIRRAILHILFPCAVAGLCYGQAGIDYRVVAEVEGVPISVQRFKGTYVQYLIRTGRDDTRENRYQHLDNLISTYLLGLEAERLGLGESEEVRVYVERQTKRIVGSRYVEVTFTEQLPQPTDQELREAFRKSKETRIVRHLLFRTLGDARIAYEELQNGADFLKLAIENTGVEDSTAGLIGEIGYWGGDDAFTEAAFSLDLDSVSTPVRSGIGWHIIRAENRLYDPLLTEDEYQLRKEHLRFQTRRRRYIIEGDRYVRTQMEALNVRVNAPAIRAIHEALSDAAASEETSKRVTVTSSEVALVSEGLSEDAILLEYSMDGERRQYLFRDYLAWLDGLPFHEAIQSTAASVGRALRNDVLASRGFAMGVDQEPFVADEIRYYQLVYLANAAARALRDHDGIEPTEEHIRNAFEQAGTGETTRVVADYWSVHLTSYEQAVQAQARISAGADAESFEGFSRFEAADITSGGGLMHHLRSIPLGRPMLLGADGGDWYVAEVVRRTSETADLDERREVIVGELTRHLPLAMALEDLREKAVIQVHTSTFENWLQEDGLD